MTKPHTAKCNGVWYLYDKCPIEWEREYGVIPAWPRDWDNTIEELHDEYMEEDWAEYLDHPDYGMNKFNCKKGMVNEDESEVRS